MQTMVGLVGGLGREATIDYYRRILATSNTLHPREGFVVPKGVRHRTRAPERAVVLMIETAGIVPTGS